MSAVDPKLMQQIVEQVLATLKGKGLSAPSAFAAPAPAKAQSPAKTDSAPAGAGKTFVSQFAPAWQRSAGKAASKIPAAPQKIFLTAEMLQRRLAASNTKGTVELAANEVLTPAAIDLADEKHITIGRAAAGLKTQAPAEAAKPSPRPGECLPGVCAAPPVVAGKAEGLGVVVLKGDAKVQSLLGALGHDHISITDFSQTDCWVCNLTNLCNAIACGQVPLGVAIMPHAADAMMLANKFKGIRAVQGTRAESVAGAIRHFGANLLVLEHAASTFHEMRQMVRTLLAEPRKAPPPGRLMDTLKELEK